MVFSSSLGSWSTTAQMISDIADYFTTEQQLVELKKFIESKGNLFGTSVSTLQNAVTTVENNLAWAEKHLDSLFRYLEGRNGADTLSSFISMLPILTIVFLKLTW